MRLQMFAGVLGGVVVAAGIAFAAAAPADAIKMRQDLMKGFGNDAKTIGDQLKSDAPDKTAIVAAFKHVAMTGKDIPSHFPAGSGAETGVKTRAKAEIWSDMAGFKAANDAFIAAAAKASMVTAASSVDDLKAAQKTLGDGCGGCHMKFRAPPPEQAK